MTTYEDHLLAARFAALAPEPLPGDWADVVERAGLARKDLPRLWRSDMLRGRRRLVVLFAVAALVAVLTASALAMRALILDRGFIGLPPQGATPSTPQSGKLEVFYWVSSPGHPRSRAWVYADGRLIWLREGADSPKAANRWSSGLLEQRLRRKGVELFRSEIASTGLFGRDLNLVTDRVRGPSEIEVRNGGRLVRVTAEHDCSGPGSCIGPPAFTTATPEQANALVRLVDRLADPESWLPARVWEDREIRAHVPSKFAVCYGWPGHPFEPSQLLTLLPDPVKHLLSAGNDRTVEWESGPHYCSDVTTEEARTLDRALDDAGLEGGTGAVGLGYRLKVPGPFQDPAVIYFEPLLPHGEFPCPCG